MALFNQLISACEFMDDSMDFFVCEFMIDSMDFFVYELIPYLFVVMLVTAVLQRR